MEKYITIGEIIKHYRIERGLSQEKLSQGICARKYLSLIEKNKSIPTLDIINQLSNRLGINLYDTYALMLNHKDIDTHKKIEHLHKHLSKSYTGCLLPLIEEYKDLPGFQSGEPLQCLKYATSLHYSNHLLKIEEAIAIATEALSVKAPFNIDDVDFSKILSNVELSLINTIAVNYCRIDQKNKAQKYFDVLHKYLTQFFTQNHYATNKNNQFELKLLANHTCNFFLFFRDTEEFKLDYIENTLTLLKSLHSHYLLPELLLCKTYMLMQSGKCHDAQKTYLLAHEFGNYLYDFTYQKEHNEQHLLGEYYIQLTEMS